MFKFGKKKGAKEAADQAADVPAVSDASAAEGEDGAAPKKKKLPLLFIVIPVALLVLGGGAPEPIGTYHSAIQLFETGVFQKNGIMHCGIAGHPEGNPDITKIHGEAMLLKALKEKQAYLDGNGITGHIATQFLFEAGPVAEWAAGLRSEGIHLPLHVGIPGPATIKTLAKYALMCGVGNSARFIRKQALNVMQLLTVNAPDEFIEELATISAAKPDLKIAAPHMYPFGGFDKLFDWMEPKMVKAA